MRECPNASRGCNFKSGSPSGFSRHVDHNCAYRVQAKSRKVQGYGGQTVKEFPCTATGCHEKPFQSRKALDKHIDKAHARRKR